MLVRSTSVVCAVGKAGGVMSLDRLAASGFCGGAPCNLPPSIRNERISTVWNQHPVLSARKGYLSGVLSVCCFSLLAGGAASCVCGRRSRAGGVVERFGGGSGGGSMVANYWKLSTPAACSLRSRVIPCASARSTRHVDVGVVPATPPAAGRSCWPVAQ